MSRTFWFVSFRCGATHKGGWYPQGIGSIADWYCLAVFERFQQACGDCVLACGTAYMVDHESMAAAVYLQSGGRMVDGCLNGRAGTFAHVGDRWPASG